MKTTLLTIMLGLVFFTVSFAEDVTITTYYPSPYGAYNELTVSGRMAIGDVNHDNVVDQRDMATYPAPAAGAPWNAGDPIQGSLTVARRIVVGRTTPFLNAELDIHSNYEWENDVASIALSSADDHGWVDQFWWLDSTGNYVKHVFSIDRDRNEQLFLYLNYDGEYHGIAKYLHPVNDTFAILHGNVAINSRDSNGNRLLVNGDTGLTGNLTVTGTGNAQQWCIASDVRFKQNIEKLTGIIEKIKSIDGVTFQWRTDMFPEKGFEKGRHIGIIAQTMEKEFPELVYTGKDGYKSLDYGKFSAVLLEAIKEQQREIEVLKKEIITLKTK